MNISSSAMADQAIASINSQQTQLAKIQSQISNGQRMQTAADDPTGWARGLALDQAVSSLGDYQSNVTLGQQRLGSEENTLGSIGDVLQSISQLAIESNSGTQSAQSRQAIATQLQQYYSQLMSYANTQDESGHYIFGGSQNSAAPFTQASAGVTYSGDTATRLLSIGQSRTIADGDNGQTVFMSAKSGNGQFTVAASASNTGIAQLTSSSVADSSLWDGGSYSISFSSGSYQVTDSTSNVVASGAYTPGSSISFRGAQLNFSGQPADGDTFSVAPSSSKDIFSTLSQLITAVQNPGSNSAQRAQVQTQLQGLQSEVSGAFDQVLNVRTSVGARLSALDDASNRLSDQSVTLQKSLSDVRSVDLVQASSELSLRTTTLQAVQLAFAKVQQLSLFSYLR